MSKLLNFTATRAKRRKKRSYARKGGEGGAFNNQIIVMLFSFVESYTNVRSAIE
jgi:hypothetical protein